MRILIVLVSLLALGALFLSTTAGRRLAERLGLPPLRDKVPKEDRAFLLKACDGNRGRVRERLDAERVRSPDASDAELHRKAIRRVFQERDS
ncbi:MAG: hypothetical protein GY937_27710 [bacterium]|nr:hypothetical protein [bacterium]